jgi:hypothetical protein
VTQQTQSNASDCQKMVKLQQLVQGVPVLLRSLQMKLQLVVGLARTMTPSKLFHLSSIRFLTYNH